MKRLLTLLVLFGFTPSAAAADVYPYIVLANIDDDKIILVDVLGEKYVVEALSYCFDFQGFDEDDIVYSTENLYACAVSTLISRTTGETCEVFCP